VLQRNTSLQCNKPFALHVYTWIEAVKQRRQAIPRAQGDKLAVIVDVDVTDNEVVRLKGPNSAFGRSVGRQIFRIGTVRYAEGL